MRRKTKRLLGIGAIFLVILVVVITLFFKFNRKEFTVKFDTDGGSFIEPINVDENSLIIKPNSPTKDGYVFDGWYYNGKPFNFDTKITKDMTLEARWEPALDNKVTGVSLNLEEISLSINDTALLVATIEPENASEKNVTWESSDSSIVTVDDNGNIKAIKNGVAEIIVTTKDGEFKATCKVTVTDQITKITKVTISGNSEVAVGSTLTLKANINPTNASNKSIQWTSSNTKIATVNQNGVVTGKSAGTVKITATTKDGSNLSATKEVRVISNNNTSENPVSTPTDQNNPTSGEVTNPDNTGNEGNTGSETSKNVPVESVSISGNKDMYVGDTINLTAIINPSDATNKNVTWTSSNEEVATVSASGSVFAKSSGSTTITVTTADGGKTSSVNITVKEKEIPKNYVVIINIYEQEGPGNVMRCTYSITENGNAFSGYRGFKYKGVNIPFGGAISNCAKDDKETSTTIVLSDGNSVSASIKYTYNK